MNIFLITIDGPSASGKTSLAKILSKKFNFDYLLTGMLFRYVAWCCVTNKNLSPVKASETNMLHKAETFSQLYNDVLISEKASQIATIPQVRFNIEHFEKQWIQNVKKPGAIIEGRDIGTAIFPHAHCKIYLTACSQVLLKRQMLRDNHKNTDDKEQMLKKMITRENLDHNRKINPLQPAKNAYIIDNSNLSITDTVNLVYDNAIKKYQAYAKIITKKTNGLIY